MVTQVPAVWERAFFETKSGQLVAVLGELITARLTWRNFTLAEGAEVTLAVIPAYYRAETGEYESIIFTEAGVEWVFGVSADDLAPAKDVEKTVSLPTVAYATMGWFPVLAGFVAVGPRITFTTLKKDARVVGISRAEIVGWWDKAYARRSFPDVLQIAPGMAEATALEFVKG